MKNNKGFFNRPTLKINFLLAHLVFAILIVSVRRLCINPNGISLFVKSLIIILGVVICGVNLN